MYYYYDGIFNELYVSSHTMNCSCPLLLARAQSFRLSVESRRLKFITKINERFRIQFRQEMNVRNGLIISSQCCIDLTIV